MMVIPLAGPKSLVDQNEPNSRVVQYCPSLGKPCGIGEYTEKLAAAKGFKAIDSLDKLKGECPPSHLHVQHEFGLIPIPELRRIIRYCKKRRIALVVSMHTVLPIKHTWRIKIANTFLVLEKFLYRLKCRLSKPGGTSVPTIESGPAAYEGNRSFFEKSQSLYLRMIEAMHVVLLGFAGKGNPQLDRNILRMLPDSTAQALILRHADQIVVHNPSARDFLLKAGTSGKCIIIFPHPVELFEVSDRLFSQNDGKRHVGCFGFLQPHKGILELIEACDRLPDTVLHLWTSTSHKSTPPDFEQRVIAAVAKRDWIQLTTRHLPLAEVVFNLSKCDVNVWYTLPPTTSLYASGSIRQYLVAKRPIIASDIQAIEEIRHLVHPVPKDRTDLLADAIAKNLKPPKGLGDYLERYCWENSRIEYVDPANPGNRAGALAP